MKAVLNAVALAAVIVVASPAHAEERMQPVQSSRLAPGAMLRDETVNRHFGFLIRPDLGGGYLSSTVGDTTVSGGAGTFGLVIGGAVQENLVLGVHLYEGVISNPSLTVSGTSNPTTDSQLSMFGIGPNLTYYFMPVNLYVSATVALTQLNATSGNFTADSSVGIGTRLSLGKEWWVSDHWGLGLAGNFSYSANNQSGSTSNPQRIDTWGLGLSFSATYN
jgi:hypothetical protein